MSSPLYNVDDAIVFFILVSLLILRMLPFSTHCWYRGTHICTESTKPPNLLTLVKYTERISKSTVHWRPSAAMTVYHPKMSRGTRKKQQRAMGNLHMATSLHMRKVKKYTHIFWSRQALYMKVSDRMKDWKARRSVDDHKIVEVNLFRVNLYMIKPW